MRHEACSHPTSHSVQFRLKASPACGAVSVFRHADRTERTARIVAPVDRAKTTLAGGMLKQAWVFRDNQPVAERT